MADSTSSSREVKKLAIERERRKIAELERRTSTTAFDAADNLLRKHDEAFRTAQTQPMTSETLPLTIDTRQPEVRCTRLSQEFLLRAARDDVRLEATMHRKSIDLKHREEEQKREEERRAASKSPTSPDNRKTVRFSTTIEVQEIPLVEDDIEQEGTSDNDVAVAVVAQPPPPPVTDSAKLDFASIVKAQQQDHSPVFSPAAHTKENLEFIQSPEPPTVDLSGSLQTVSDIIINSRLGKVVICHPELPPPGHDLGLELDVDPTTDSDVKFARVVAPSEAMESIPEEQPKPDFASIVLAQHDPMSELGMDGMLFRKVSSASAADDLDFTTVAPAVEKESCSTRSSMTYADPAALARQLSGQSASDGSVYASAVDGGTFNFISSIMPHHMSDHASSPTLGGDEMDIDSEPSSASNSSNMSNMSNMSVRRSLILEDDELMSAASSSTPSPVQSVSPRSPSPLMSLSQFTQWKQSGSFSPNRNSNNMNNNHFHVNNDSRGPYGSAVQSPSISAVSAACGAFAVGSLGVAEISKSNTAGGGDSMSKSEQFLLHLEIQQQMAKLQKTRADEKKKKEGERKKVRQEAVRQLLGFQPVEDVSVSPSSPSYPPPLAMGSVQPNMVDICTAANAAAGIACGMPGSGMGGIGGVRVNAEIDTAPSQQQIMTKANNSHSLPGEEGGVDMYYSVPSPQEGKQQSKISQVENEEEDAYIEIDSFRDIHISEPVIPGDPRRVVIVDVHESEQDRERKRLQFESMREKRLQALSQRQDKQKEREQGRRDKEKLSPHEDKTGSTVPVSIVPGSVPGSVPTSSSRPTQAPTPPRAHPAKPVQAAVVKPFEQPLVKGLVEKIEETRGEGKSKLKFARSSNRKLIRNAITTVCMAGDMNRKEREEILQVMDQKPEVQNFIILFKGALGRKDLRGLYAFDPSSNTVELLACVKPCPQTLDDRMVSEFYRYDSGSKEFKHLSSIRSFGLVTDAVTLIPSLLKRPLVE